MKLIAPRLVPRVWGGTRLAGLFPDAAPQEPAEVRIGEAWFGEIGDRRPLIKLLDVQDRLSVQVHPDDALAAELHGAGTLGKHEAWIILEAAPNAHLLLGRDPAVSAEQISASLAGGETVEPLLARISVKAGDALDVPPGTLHALMPGLLVWEVQQPSDLTYRVSDWGRDHPARPLHQGEARRATDPAATVKRLHAIDWAKPGVCVITLSRAFEVRAVVGPWIGKLDTPRGATLTLISRNGADAEAQIGGVTLHALQSASCEEREAPLSLPLGAALLVAEPGRTA
ncbi:MAG: class I mannose-6-phosphate isomerase [Candidatus Limnocylindrus sp.]